jgi:hypothetical protein
MPIWLQVPQLLWLTFEKASLEEELQLYVSKQVGGQFSQQSWANFNE